MSVEIDWKSEKENLKQGYNWWKPKIGTHKVKILNDGDFYTTKAYSDGKIDEKKPDVEKIRFDIEVNSEKFAWGVTRGISESSLYGQLVLVGDSKGTLVGAEITVIAKGEGTERDYTIPEALPLMTAKEEKVN